MLFWKAFKAIWKKRKDTSRDLNSVDVVQLFSLKGGSTPVKKKQKEFAKQ
jgi:hypothetical protein